MRPFAEAFPFAPQPAYPFVGWGAIPLKLDVRLTASDEVQDLRRQLSELASQVQQLKDQVNRLEYLYRCETIINLQLTDYCRAQGVKVPRHLLQRPYDPAAV